MQKGYSSLLSFTVTDINSTVTKLMTLGAELDGPIKHEIHGKVNPTSEFPVWFATCAQRCSFAEKHASYHGITVICLMALLVLATCRKFITSLSQVLLPFCHEQMSDDNFVGGCGRLQL